MKRFGVWQRFYLMPALLLGLIITLGCARTNPPPAFSETQTLVRARVGMDVEWQKDGVDSPDLARATQDLIARPLTLENAVRLALMRNRTLQARLGELDIAQTELLEASLPANPKFSISHRYLHGAENGHDTNTEAGLSQEVMSLVLLPWRRAIAKGELAQAQLDAAEETLELVREVQEAYFTMRGRQAERLMQRQAFQATEAGIVLAREQHAVGNISDLDFSRHLGEYQQERLELAEVEVELLADRERLNRLTGLWGDAAGHWTLPETMPELPEREMPMEQLESRAIEERLDLAAARAEMMALHRGASLARWSRWLPGLSLGVETERELDGERITGPTLEAEIPIFDWGQTRMARSQAKLRQSRQRLSAMATDIRSQVREEAYRLQATRQTVVYHRDVLLPERQRALQLAMLHYQGMFLGTDELLEVKRKELETHRRYLGSVRDYWIARAALERAMGGALRAGDIPEETVVQQATQPSKKRTMPDEAESQTMMNQDHPQHH